MKKALVLVLSFVMVASAGLFLVYCGGDDGPCKNKECGTIEGENCGECTAPETCDTTTNMCVAGCADLEIKASGIVVNPIGATPTPVSVALSPIAPLQALTPGDPTLLFDMESEADGTFATDCFDVETVALGLVILTDDKTWDDAGGTYFPTATGVKAWTLDSEKVDVVGAKVMAIPNTLVAGMAAIPGFDATNEGFAMGMVVDANEDPIAGATITAQDGSDVGALYPNLTFTDFSGTSTSAAGVYVIPGFTTSPTYITAVAAGHTFDNHPAGSKGGYCFFLPIPANE